MGKGGREGEGPQNPQLEQDTRDYLLGFKGRCLENNHPQHERASKKRKKRTNHSSCKRGRGDKKKKKKKR